MLCFLHLLFQFGDFVISKMAYRGKPILLLTAKMLGLDLKKKKKKKSVYLTRRRCKGLTERYQLKCITPREGYGRKKQAVEDASLCEAQIVG